MGYFVTPLLNVALGALVLGERLRRAQLAAIALAAAGVVYLAVHGHGLPWVAVVLATSFAAYGFMRKRAPADALLGLGVETVVLTPLAALYLVHLALTGRSAFPEAGLRVDVMLLLSGMVTALPLLWFTHAARSLSLTSLGLLQYISPTCQFLLAIGVYGEPFTPTHAVTFGLIWCGIALYVVASARTR
jgi:chloramphenicol-sensitive protein RarD